ncbi:molybdenum cofactor guanylyltransferase [Halochromatium salexigens]
MLAGGAGRRMRGVDKGLIELDGRPLVQWVAEALRPQVATLLISANRHRERYAQFGWPVLADHAVRELAERAADLDVPSAAAVPNQDQIQPFQGPLAGIASALAQIRVWLQQPLLARPEAQTDGSTQIHFASAPAWLLVSPCDTPLIPVDLGSRLAAALQASQARIAIAADQERSQPLHALIPTDIDADLADYLHSGRRSVLGWLARHQVATVTFEKIPSPFVNLNRPEDAARVQAQLTAKDRP